MNFFNRLTQNENIGKFQATINYLHYGLGHMLNPSFFKNFRFLKVLSIIVIFINIPFFTIAQVWYIKAPMITPRSNATSVVLDNKIYVLGGGNSLGIYSNVEVYDPTTNTWASKAPMNVPRGEFVACVVNGKIYVIGGYNSVNGALSSVEEYDPLTNTWVFKAPMPIARSLLSGEFFNNKIYVVGGWPGTLNVLHEYDPVLNSWTTKTPCPTARHQINCFKNINGKLYFVGGKVASNNVFYSSNEVYNPATNNWTTNSPLPNTLWSGTLTILNNKLHHIGGTNHQYYPNYNYHYIYDPIANIWSNGLALPVKRSAHVSVTLNDVIYIIGGFDSVGNIVNTNYVLENCNNNIIQQDTISACGTSVLINATNGLTNYQWSSGDTTASTNVTSTGWYTLTAQDGNCTLTDSVFVSLVNANIQQNDTTICSGTSLTLSVAQPSLGQTPCNSSLLPANLQNGLVGYWPFCGNANDASGNGHHGVNYGAIITTDRFGNSGSAFSFNGVSSYIQVPNIAIQGSGSRTTSFWLKTSEANEQMVIATGSGINQNGATYNIRILQNGYLGFMGGNFTNCCYDINPNTGIFVKDNNWHNCVVVRNGNLFQFYVDGVLGYSQSVAINTIGQTNYFGISNDFNVWNSYPFNGKIDDILIWNRALTQNEILQLYTPASTPVNNNNFNLSYLWSTGDSSATINVNPTQTTSYWVQVSNGITTCTDTIHIMVNSLSNLIVQDTISTCGSSTTINATPNLNNYQWSNGSNTASTNVTSAGWYSVTASNGVCTGTDSVFVSLVNANIQQNDTTICSGASLTLSVAQPSVGQTPCNANALPTSLQNGLVGYWPFCGNTNDASGNGHHGVNYGAIITADRFGNSGSAFSFNGVSSYIQVPNIAIQGSGSRTTSFWLKTSATNVGMAISTGSGINQNGATYNIRVLPNGFLSFMGGNFTSCCYDIDPNTGIYLIDNTWHNCVVVRNGNLFQFYVDGILSYSQTLSINTVGQSNYFGRSNDILPCCFDFFNGKIDDILIWNRALTQNEILQLYTPASTPVNNNNFNLSYLWSTGDSSATINVNPTQSTSYWVQVSNGITTCTDTIHITVSNPTVNITASPNDTLCAGQSLSLTASGAGTYSWTGGVVNGQSFVPANSGTYTVTATTAAGCTATSSIGITINPTPTLNTSASPSVICTGTNSVLSATGASNYVWQPGNLAGSPTVSPTTTTTYTVTGTNANGCSTTATRTINVNASPSLISSATPSSICVGSNVVLSANGATSYTWQPGNLNGSPTVNPTTTTVYTVTGTNANGCMNTAIVTVSVNSLPNVLTNANPSSICLGASSTLSATGGTSYSWMPGNLNGAPSVSPTATTTYTVTATNANGCSNTSTLTVTVNNIPTVTTTAIPSSICLGGSSTLSATGGTSYSWLPGNLTGTPSVSPTVTTTYTVTATNANGCSNTSTLLVTVNNLPTVSTTATPSSICLGGSSTLSATGGTNYSWMPGNLSGTPSVSPTATTTYTVTATNANGCSNTSTLLVTVNNLPTVSTSATPSSICLGGSSILSATGGTSYLWMPGNLTGTPSVSPTATTTYTVTATNANGCSNTSTLLVTVNNLPTVSTSATPSSICLGGSSILSATGGTSYLWMPGNLTGTPNVSPIATITYTVTATNANGCTNTATVTVQVNSIPNVVTNASPSSICIGASSTLSATGGTSYSWMPGNLNGTPSVTPTATITYTVTATNANGCSNTATVSVQVNSLPNLAVNASPTSVCLGSATTLTATGASTYQWQPGNLTGSPSVSPTTNITYSVIGTDGNGCSNSATLSVAVNALPNANANANPNSICSGSSSQLSASGGTNYLWQPGNFTGSPIVTPNANTIYTVTVSNANGCSATSTVSVTVNASPNIVIAGNAPAICIGTSYLLNASGGVSYIWMPGNLGGLPTVTPLTTTTYTVTGTDANGCSNTTSLTLMVNSLPSINASASQNAVCQGATTILSANGGLTYTWQPGNLSGTPTVTPNTATTYTVTGIDNNGCSNTATVAITVNSLPNVTAAAVPNEICNGGSSTLQGSGASSYLWMPLNIFGSPMVFPNVTTTYTVTGTSANGCTATATALLNVVAPPVITQQPANQVSTNGNSAQFTVQCNNPNATYIWQRDNGFGFQSLSNGGQYSGVNTNTLTISNLTQAQNGNLFRCQVSLPGCNVYSAQAILKVEFALGVGEYNNMPIGIYPNPATSTLHISTPATYLGSQLQLRDMSGRVCYETTLTQEETDIPVASWARGVYMLQVHSAQGKWVYRVLLRD